MAGTQRTKGNINYHGKLEAWLWSNCPCPWPSPAIAAGFVDVLAFWSPQAGMYEINPGRHTSQAEVSATGEKPHFSLLRFGGSCGLLGNPK